MEDRRIDDRRIVAVEKDVKIILENRLPSIQMEVTKLSTQMKIYGGLILAGITALIALGLQQ